jgi:hypothetical protein
VVNTAARFVQMAATLTLGQQRLVDAFNIQLGEFGHVLSSGTNSFPCLITAVAPAELAMTEMFSDLREVSKVRALQTDLPAGIVAQVQLTDENGQAWTTLKRVNNASQICAEFWVQQITDKDH